MTRSRGGCVQIVGIGPGGEDELSLGALRAIQSAEELWMLDLGPPTQERFFLRKWLKGKAKVVNVYGYYLIPGCPREVFYELMARRILHLAKKGRRITLLSSGNPLIWVSGTDLFKRWAGSVPVRIIPSMSFLDTIFLETPFSCGELQLRLTGVTDPDISPELDCLVGQVADDGTSDLSSPSAARSFFSALRRFYSNNHPAYIIGNHSIYGEPKLRTTTVGLLSASIREFIGWHYSILLPSVKRARALKGQSRP
jgi:hypothetical protein